jgi:hypothetical protein
MQRTGPIQHGQRWANMGACDISFDIKGEVSFRTIVDKFKEQRDLDEQMNGHQDGYSGDFQTVGVVKDHTDKVFSSRNEAMDYCLKTAEKWESVVAVRYKNATCYKSKKLSKLGDKIDSLVKVKRDLERKGLKFEGFLTCSSCKSKVNTVHLRSHNCPVCRDGDFRPKSFIKKIQSLDKKINELNEKHKAQSDLELSKAASKCKEINTLVAGWGAC